MPSTDKEVFVSRAKISRIIAKSLTRLTHIVGI